MVLRSMLIGFFVMLILTLTMTLESGPSREQETQAGVTSTKDQVLPRMKRARFGFRMRPPSFKPRVHFKPIEDISVGGHLRKASLPDSQRPRADSDSHDARSHSHDSRHRNDDNTDIDDANDPNDDKPMYRETREQVDEFAAGINHPKKHEFRRRFRETMKRAYEGSTSARNKLKKAAKLLLEYGPDFFDLGSSIMDMVMAAEELKASLQPQAEPTHATARDQYIADDSMTDDNFLLLLQAMLEQHSSGSGSDFLGNGIFPGNVVVIVATHALVYA